ncbi:cytochrome c [Albimonas sp. CAU 1670]|uniref:c-type cytochrome n=1 Tax=Albimonas sp. CAU 1670 TaxID=3032599 RepID=UPI0023DADCFC|nr:cytochrome c [Albimonas sp. CAU 1670]MDF2233789.1 cytochrome c [Albimonas sp. CAU 1670]
MMKRGILALACGGAILAGAGALAHGGAEGVVKERMEAMKAIADATKAIGEMLKGATPYDAAAVREQAGVIASQGGEKLVAMFPKGTDHAPSEAAPAIWSDPERFAALADELAAVAEALAEAADNARGPEAMKQAGMMGGGGMTSGAMGSMMGDGGPSAERLAAMPPEGAFMHLAQTCKACHQDFRIEK